MGVSFTWLPYKPKTGKSWGSGSSLNSALEELFGSFPIILTQSDIPKLEGVKACGYEEISEIIQALYEYEKIKIEAHW